MIPGIFQNILWCHDHPWRQKCLINLCLRSKLQRSSNRNLRDHRLVLCIDTFFHAWQAIRFLRQLLQSFLRYNYMWFVIFIYLLNWILFFDFLIQFRNINIIAVFTVGQYCCLEKFQFFWLSLSCLLFWIHQIGVLNIIIMPQFLRLNIIINVLYFKLINFITLIK